MKMGFRRCVLCAGMLALLGASPALAVPGAVDLPAVESTAPVSTPPVAADPGIPGTKGPSTEDAVTDVLTMMGEGKPGQEKKAEGWLSGDGLIKVAAGFGAGLAAAILGALGWKLLFKKERKLHAEEQEHVEQQFDEESIVTEVEPERRQPARPQVDRKPSVWMVPSASGGTLGTVHNVGRRKNQQDTLGTTITPMGLLAVVSDGMGGLSDGEKVSQQAVKGMFQAAGRVTPSPYENPLFEMLSEANDQVLQMLGPDQIYKSGATLLAVLVDKGGFHWCAVGDSRIYFYCGHHLLQVNREHIYKQQLILDAVNRNIGFPSVSADSQKDRLVSFLGMGEIKYIDGSLSPVELRSGDKLLLMSDGIFNTISEREILRILESTNNAVEAAALMEKQVLAAENPRQDNFTCIILDF